MLTGSRVIPMNSRTLEGQKVLLRVIGMFKSSNKSSRGNKVQVLSTELLRRGRMMLVGQKKSHQKYEQWTI